jgi:hypothetical protein
MAHGMTRKSIVAQYIREKDSGTHPKRFGKRFKGWICSGFGRVLPGTGKVPAGVLWAFWQGKNPQKPGDTLPAKSKRLLATS